MKYLRVLIAWVLFLLLASPSHAIDEDSLKQRIAKHLEKVTAGAKIQEPFEDLSTRSPTGSKLFRTASNGIVLVVTANDTMGSGVVISSRGLVITNWHVVENEPIVGIIFKQTFRPGRTSLNKEDIFPAKVLRTDSVRDLALLLIISPPPDLTTLQLGSLQQVEVGEDVFAISHPAGLLWSYTEGVISQIRPNYVMKTESGSVHRSTYIQTQTVISQGSSGGALFNYNGQLIGILTATLGPGLNFAIAVNEIQEFIKSTLEKR